MPFVKPSGPPAPKIQLRDLTYDELQRMLDDALSKEDYEKAARSATRWAEGTETAHYS
jgi:hypothetical protein